MALGRRSLTAFPNSIHTIVLHEQLRKSVLCTLRRIVAKLMGYPATVACLALALMAVPGLARQTNASPADDAAQTSAPGAQEPLDLQEAVARDVLEPLQAGMQSHNLKQVLSVFDPESIPNFPQLRDRIKAMLDAYAAFQFRYKILQASAEDHRASMTCEIDLDATPVDEGQVPTRRSTQMRLQLTQTPKGWRISAFTPNDFFYQ